MSKKTLKPAKKKSKSPTPKGYTAKDKGGQSDRPTPRGKGQQDWT